MRLLFALLLIPNLALASVGEIGKVKGSGAIERGSDSLEAKTGVGIMMQDTAVTATGKMQSTSWTTPVLTLQNTADYLLMSLFMILQMILAV